MFPHTAQLAWAMREKSLSRKFATSAFVSVGIFMALLARPWKVAAWTCEIVAAAAVAIWRLYTTE